MGFFDFLKPKSEKFEEKRAETLPVDGGWGALFGDFAGLDAAKAFNIPAFAASVNQICEAVAMIPVKLYKFEETAKGKVTSEVFDDVRVNFLNDDTGDTLGGVQFKRALVRDYLVHGNAYAFIHKKSGKIKGLHHVSAQNLNIISNNDPIFKDYDIQVQNLRFKPFEFLKILRSTTDGMAGRGVLQENKELLATAYSIMNLQQNLASKNGNKKGFINAKTRLSKESMEAIRGSVEQLYNDRERNIIVLNEGLEFKESSNTSVEMQLNENKKSLNFEIKSIFGINVDSQGKFDYASFIKTAVLPVINEFECALNRDLLQEKEKKSLYFAFDTKEVLKSDPNLKTRFEAYKTALDANIMQIDEVRYMEDLEPLGLNFIKLGLQDVLYNPQTKEVFTPNTGQKISVEKNKNMNENKEKN